MGLSLGLVSALLMSSPPVQAGAVMDEFAKAAGAIDSYTASIVTHEIDGTNTQDRVYSFGFLAPHSAKIEIVSGPGHGSGAAWTGGDTVRGHMGGILSGIKQSISIHDSRATSLRGDTIDSASFPSQLEHFKTTKGEITEGAGPVVGGVDTDTITLVPAVPGTDHPVTKDVLFISKVTHLPVRRERYAGDTLVKREDFQDVKLHAGLTDKDF